MSNDTNPTLEPHPFAELFPMMSDEEATKFAQDMAEHGYCTQYPIVLYQGRILDGRNRYRAAQAAEVDPLFTEFEGTDGEALRLVARGNLARRHLTTKQRAEIAAKMCTLRLGDNQHTAEEGASNEAPPMSEAKAAEAMAVSRSSVQRAKARAAGKSKKPRTKKAPPNRPKQSKKRESKAQTSAEPTKQTNAEIEPEQLPSSIPAVEASTGEAGAAASEASPDPTRDAIAQLTEGRGEAGERAETIDPAIIDAVANVVAMLQLFQRKRSYVKSASDYADALTALAESFRAVAEAATEAA